MMLQKLPIFLKENSAKLLIKYDGERKTKKYTIKVLFDDIKSKNLGFDTDLLDLAIDDIFKDNGYFEQKEMLNFFYDVINIGIDRLKSKFSDKCIVSVTMAEKEGGILYTLHIQNGKDTNYLSGINYKEVYETLLLEKV